MLIFKSSKDTESGHSASEPSISLSWRNESNWPSASAIFIGAIQSMCPDGLRETTQLRSGWRRTDWLWLRLLKGKNSENNHSDQAVQFSLFRSLRNRQRKERRKKESVFCCAEPAVLSTRPSQLVRRERALEHTKNVHTQGIVSKHAHKLVWYVWQMVGVCFCHSAF